MAFDIGDVARVRASDGFKRLFPHLEASKIKDTVQTEVMVTMCNLVQFAFGSYKDPEVKGLTEHTLDNQQIQYLSYEFADNAYEGVLKIHLKEANNVIVSDIGWGNLSDPYILFSSGTTCIKSEVIKDTRHPVWNSTQYLPLRKHHIRSDFDGKLSVALFDDDTHQGPLLWRTIANYLDQDDFLGSAEIDLERLKDPGVHTFELELKNGNGSTEDGMTVTFSTEFITFQKACEELGMPRESSDWMPPAETPTGVGCAKSTNESWMSELSRLCRYPFAFIHVPSTDTQAWLYVNRNSKSILVAFRGTETNKIKDVVLDLTAYPTKPGPACDEVYILKPTDALKYEDIRLHSGFLTGYNSVREAILQVVYDITQWEKDWNICITGHSLGGALATLCAFEFSNRRNEQGGGPVIGMMNFGAPRVGNKAFAHIYNNTVLYSFRVVDREDIVHLIPPFYTHTAKELLCFPDGEVFVEGVSMKELDPALLFTNTREVEVEREDAGSLEEIFQTYGRQLDGIVEKHLSKNYFSIISTAVTKFLHRTEKKDPESPTAVNAISPRI